MLLPLQVTGFFVLESFVSRVTEGLLGPLEAAQVSGRHDHCTGHNKQCHSRRKCL
jgi:hypothetical protein